MGAIQNSVNQAIGATGVALHSNDLKQKQQQKQDSGTPSMSHASRVAQSLDPDKNEQGATMAKKVLRKQQERSQETKQVSLKISTNINDRVKQKELMRMK